MTATRRLFVTLVAVLVPFLAVRIGAHLLVPDGTTVTDGVLRVAPDGVAWLAVSALWWTAAVVAGMASVTSARPVVRVAGAALPAAIGALVGIGLVAAVGAVILGAVLPAEAALVVMLAAVLIAVAAAPVARLALVAPAAVVRAGQRADAGPTGGAGRVVAGEWWRVAGTLAGGVLAPAVALAWLLGRLNPRGPVLGVGYFLLEAVLLVAVAAAQARALVAAHRAASGAEAPGADLSGADQSRVGTSGRPVAGVGPAPRASGLRIAIAVAALALPAIFAGVGAAAAPLPRITISTEPDGGMSVLQGVAWPAHRHPVLVGLQSIYDCTDDACTGIVTTPLGVLVYAPIGGVAVAPDGSVYALGQRALAYCDPERHCRHTEMLPVIDGTAAAIAVAPDGGLLMAMATPAAPDGERVALRLVHCADIDCAAPRVTALGTFPGSSRREDTWIQQMMAVAVGADGRPVVAFRTQAGAVFVAWCATTVCDRGEVAPIDARPAGAPDDADLVALDDTGLIGCRTDVCAATAPTPAVARPGGGVYELLVEERAPDGARVQLGVPDSAPLHTTLLTCRDDRCRDADRLAVHDDELGGSNWPRPYPSEMWMLAANPDGRVLLVRPHDTPHTVITVRP